jgi:hypothetical protein
LTIICYKDGILACDSAWSEDQYLVTRATKIVRLPSGALLGEAGDDDSRAFRELLARVKTPGGLPSRKQLLELQMDYCAILVLPKGRIFHIQVDEPNDENKLTHWTGGLFEIGESYHAIGSGKEHGITALECGRSARDAVYAAIRRHNQCRAPVHTLSLTPPDKDAKAKK